MTPKDPFLEGTFGDKFWRPLRSRGLLFTPDLHKVLSLPSLWVSPLDPSLSEKVLEERPRFFAHHRPWTAVFEPQGWADQRAAQPIQAIIGHMVPAVRVRRQACGIVAGKPLAAVFFRGHHGIREICGSSHPRHREWPEYGWQT